MDKRLADALTEWVEARALVMVGGNKKEVKKQGLHKIDKKGVRTVAERLATAASGQQELGVCRDALLDKSAHWSVRAGVIGWMGLTLPSSVAAGMLTADDVTGCIAPFLQDNHPLVSKAAQETMTRFTERTDTTPTS
jgi:hypothetical protein